MAEINILLSILTLNIGLNFQIKRHKIVSWINEQDLMICFLQGTHLTDKDKHWLRVRKHFQANGYPKQARVVALIPDKGDFEPKLIIKDKEGQFILIKGTIYQEEMTIIKIKIS
jgi:hypothetical protein